MRRRAFSLSSAHKFAVFVRQGVPFSVLRAQIRRFRAPKGLFPVLRAQIRRFCAPMGPFFRPPRTNSLFSCAKGPFSCPPRTNSPFLCAKGPFPYPSRTNSPFSCAKGPFPCPPRTYSLFLCAERERGRKKRIGLLRRTLSIHHNRWGRGVYRWGRGVSLFRRCQMGYDQTGSTSRVMCPVYL